MLSNPVVENAPAPAAARPKTAESRPFFGELESLRGIAALLVALHHIGWKSPITHCGLLWNSYLMVDFFFVLSGFVICHSYAAKVADFKGFTRFAWLRLGRLYPLHFAMLLVFVGFEVLKYIGERKYGYVPGQSEAFTLNGGSAFVTNLLLIHAFGFTNQTTFNGPSWSIGVEFYTYLVFGAVLLLGRSRKAATLIMGLLCIPCIVLLNVFHGPNLDAFTGQAFFRCVLGFSLGVVIYDVYLRYKESISRWNQWWVMALAFGLLVFLGFKKEDATDYVVLPVFSLLILYAASAPKSAFARGLNWQPLRWMGRVSYSIYMVHLAVMLVMLKVYGVLVKKLPWHSDFAASLLGLALVPVAVAVVLGLSHLSYRFIEEFFQNRSKHLAARWFNQQSAGSNSRIVPVQTT